LLNNDSDVEAFDRRAETYETGYRGRFHAAVDESVTALVLDAAPTARSVLDVGCGIGALLRALGEAWPAASLVGVDPAPTMLAAARRTAVDLPNVVFEQAGAEALPFAADSFDLVVSVTSFHHWRDRRQGVCEVARVLRPEGVFVLADHFATGWLQPFAWFGRRRMETLSSSRSMLLDAGLSRLRERRIFDVGPLPLVRALVAAA
jgi:ubiquinone/menaquinone biosynthesis C-methylase UbiE